MTIRQYDNITPQIADSVYVDPSAEVIGNVVIGARSSIWPHVVIRGDVNNIRIGEETNIQDGTIIHVTHDGPFTPAGSATTIGNQVTIGHGVIVHACSIEDLSIIGMGSIILDKALIQSNVMLGAGSLVPEGKCLKSGFLYFGRPARQVRALTEKEVAYIEYSAKYYHQLSQKHRNWI